MHHRGHKVENSISIAYGSRPNPAGRVAESIKVWKLGGPIQSVGNEFPFLKVAAGVDWDSGEGEEARGGAEEGVVPFRNKDTRGVGVETREDGIVVG